VRDVEHERRRASLNQVLREARHAWHGVKLNQPDWSPFSHTVAIDWGLRSEGVLAYMILNAYWEPLDFELPVWRDGRENWRRWIDTGLDPPHDICEWNAEQPVPGPTYCTGARSVVVLIAGKGQIAGTSTQVESAPASSLDNGRCS
jgi:glycogen operon protein